MRLEDAETLVTQNYNVSSSWCELCGKRKNLEKFRRWKFWNLKAIVPSSKIIGLYLKNYFDEKNKISKKSKFKSQSRRFFKKRDQKIENLDKKFCQTSIPKFFFFNSSGYMINRRWKKSETCQKMNRFPFFLRSQQIISFYDLDMNLSETTILPQHK